MKVPTDFNKLTLVEAGNCGCLESAARFNCSRVIILNMLAHVSVFV